MITVTPVAPAAPPPPTPQCAAGQVLQATSDPQSFSDGSAANDEYGHNSQCSWTITAPTGGRVQLSFNRFALEGSSAGGCSADWVQIYDGTSTWSTSLGRHCGTTLPPARLSSGTSLHVVFHSNGLGDATNTGFEASYFIIGARKRLLAAAHCSATMTDRRHGAVHCQLPHRLRCLRLCVQATSNCMRRSPRRTSRTAAARPTYTATTCSARGQSPPQKACEWS